MAYKVTVDTGGTFTDVVLADGDRLVGIYKALTTPDDVLTGVKEAMTLAADAVGRTLESLLAETQVFVYATTRSTNAILEKKTAKTAFLTTAGHRDILLYREGGKPEPFNFTIPYPEPYVPRHLTFEVTERILADGTVDIPLDEESLRVVLGRLRELEIEAVGVCLLWSFLNPEHEIRVGTLIEEILPGVAYTLSHRINPIIREYRRASSTVIDASIKPLMGAHLREIDQSLRDLGFRGEPLMVTHASGGVLPFAEMADKPLHTVDSGPAMAPVAALTYARVETGTTNVIVVDTGGTSFDVSLVRDGLISNTREKWLGEQFLGHMTGMSAIDSRSVGAGGGSIAWVDHGGLLHVGPQSAGAFPGPACYGRGGTLPTVTDAAAVLGFIDGEYFLGGRMQLDLEQARVAVERDVARPLQKKLDEAATAIIAVASEVMRSHIYQMTVDQGLDPRECLLVAGGGASGLNIVTIAREMQVRQVLIPRLAAALSAVGGQFSDLTGHFTTGFFTTTNRFDRDGVNGVLERISTEMDAFFERLGGAGDRSREFVCEARYAHQVWELEVPLAKGHFDDDSDLNDLIQRFHEVHERVFAIREPGQRIECVNWRGRATEVVKNKPSFPTHDVPSESAVRTRQVVFGDEVVPTPCYRGGHLPAGTVVAGPAIIEEPTTTVVLIPGSSATVTPLGNYLVDTMAT